MLWYCLMKRSGVRKIVGGWGLTARIEGSEWQEGGWECNGDLEWAGGDGEPKREEGEVGSWEELGVSGGRRGQLQGMESAARMQRK